jgi:hypothetical protein
VATDRLVDLIEERIDLALWIRSALTSDAALTMRFPYGSNRQIKTNQSTLFSEERCLSHPNNVLGSR